MLTLTYRATLVTHQIAIRLGRFLALSNDPHELAGILVPNYDTFWWANPTTRANGATVYGF